MGVNVPPPNAAFAVWVFRQVVALVFVSGWLVWTGIDIYRGTENVPFWINAVGVGVLAYALGVNVADISAWRLGGAPSPTASPTASPTKEG